MHTAWQHLSARYHYYVHAAGVLLDVAAHRELSRTLRQPSLRALLEARDDLSHKYLWPCLSRHLDRGQRLAIMLSHYRCLAERGIASLSAQLLEYPEVVWDRTEGEDHFTISLCFLRRQWDQEGELCLVFEANALPLYRLAFTIADGAALECDERQVLFVGGLQGNAGRFDQIRTATRACDDIAPRACLLAAADGLAQALGLGAIVGVGNDTHITRATTAPEQFRFDYDELWTALGGVARAGYFTLPVPLTDKPPSLVTASHRRRAMRRRAFREQVAEHVRARFTKRLLAP